MDITEFIPDEFAAYRKAIGDAFRFFLERLPADRASAESGPLQRGVAPELPERIDRLIAYAMTRPTLHKLGQVLARHRSFPPSFRAALQRLESYGPRTPMSAVRETIRAELGDRAGRIEIAPAALAEASVAVVVPFSWSDPNDQTRREGVLKVLKPGVVDRLHEDFAVWSELGDYLDDRCRTYGLPEFDYRDTFDSVTELLRNEIDLPGEQANLCEAAHLCAGTSGIVVPRLLPFCTSRITAM